MKLLICGYGDIGQRLASLAQPHYDNILAIARHPSGPDIEPCALDLDQPGACDKLPWAGQDVAYFAPPPAPGNHDTRLANVLASMAPNPPRRMVYISTSGVYGDCAGAWVDEASPTRPQSDRAKRRLDAEQQLRSFSAQYGTPVIILRVPGIYGPGRLPLERIKSALPVICPEQAPWSNRIHSEDLARIALLALQTASEGIEVFNVADGSPSTMTEYFYAVADALKLPRPPCVSLEDAPQHLTPAMMSFINESRRMRIDKLKNVLGFEPQYPDLKSGLKQILESP